MGELTELCPLEATMTELRLVCANEDDDDELMARLRAGDWSALDRLYHRYALPVFQRCWRVLREREISWQVTQDTFAALLAHLPCRPVRDWLFDTCSRLSAQAAADRPKRCDVRHQTSNDSFPAGAAAPSSDE